MTQIRRTEVLITGNDPDQHPGQVFPLEPTPILRDERFPGIIVETLMGDWKYVAYRLQPGEAPTHLPESNYRLVYSSTIDETLRVVDIKMKRGDQEY